MDLSTGHWGIQCFDQRLKDVFMSALLDPVYAVRESAAQNLRILVQLFGVEWAKQDVIPRVLSLSGDNSYLRRIISLFCVNSLSEVMNLKDIKEMILPTVIGMSNDNVANVRFNVCKTIQKISPYLDKSVLKKDIKPTLNKLVEARPLQCVNS